ncbi:transporter [Haladaptatus sp. R4]|uniref:DMT family transporter n=1 Tax=Haladaptatus sp. R4 TaxID=1679489 RepID=UPI0007B4A994|nr:EamA family transporter [Haladaptatus sp. R4]KZN25526.1 transporter [Haladaptatus sp. R4]
MTRYRNVLLFVILAAFWGSAFMAIRAGLEFIPPVLFAAIRYDVAGVLMLAYAIYVTDRWRPRTRGEWTLVLVGGALMIAAYHSFLFIGERRTPSAAAAIIVSLSPILTSGFARIFLPSERLTPAGIAGLLLGFVGVAVLSLSNSGSGESLTTTVIPQLLVFLAAFSFALGSVLTQRIEAELPIETMEAWSMLLGALMMHAISVARPSESFSAIRWTPDAIAAIAYLSIFASAIGFLIYFDLLDRLGAVEINLVSYVAPLFAALTGWYFLDEVVTPLTVVGFCIVFAGFCLLKRNAISRELPRITGVFTSGR